MWRPYHASDTVKCLYSLRGRFPFVRKRTPRLKYLIQAAGERQASVGVWADAASQHRGKALAGLGGLAGHLGNAVPSGHAGSASPGVVQFRFLFGGHSLIGSVLAHTSFCYRTCLSWSEAPLRWPEAQSPARPFTAPHFLTSAVCVFWGEAREGVSHLPWGTSLFSFGVLSTEFTSTATSTPNFPVLLHCLLGCPGPRTATYSQG